MGFCIFNFAVGAAKYALEKYNLSRICILDFDVHYGNGIADLIAADPRIRYASLHQLGVFPPGGEEVYSGPLNNIRNVGVPEGSGWESYRPLLVDRVLPFLADFEPQLVIVSAGYDALESDELASVSLLPVDYHRMASHIKTAFGPVMMGLEGGYNLNDLPLAVEQTLIPYLPAETAS